MGFRKGLQEPFRADPGHKSRTRSVCVTGVVTALPALAPADASCVLIQGGRAGGRTWGRAGGAGAAGVPGDLEEPALAPCQPAST